MLTDLGFVCTISGAFYLVGGIHDINSAVQSNKVDWCVKSKQLVEGTETEREIKKEKAEDLNDPCIILVPWSQICPCFFFYHFQTIDSIFIVLVNIECACSNLTLTVTLIGKM